MTRAFLLAFRHVEGHAVYFAGRTHNGEEIVTTTWRGDAVHFATASEAYACANTHPEMADSEFWRVVRR